MAATACLPADLHSSLRVCAVRALQKMQAMIAESQQTAGPTMMFATIDYEGCCVKADTEKLANRWSSLLYSTGMDAQA